MKNPLVSVLIVNWNGADVLDTCIRSLINQSYKQIEIIVVDNNSSDTSREILKKYKEILLIPSSQNLGFAGGNNLAYTKAKGKYILLLNTDTIVTKNFLQELVSEIEQDITIGIVQPKVLYENGTINSLGAFLTATGFLYYPGYGKKDNLPLYNKETDVFSAYGACMLISRKVIDKIGLFDPDYFMYFEETDFCMRVWLSGWKIKYTPKSLIHHKGGISSKKFGLEKIYFHSFKNRMCTYVKNLDLVSLFKILPVHLLICEGISLIYLLTGKVSFFIAVQKAFFWNISNIGSIYKKRRYIQKELRQVHDNNYLPIISRSPRLSYYLYLFKGLQYYKD